MHHPLLRVLVLQLSVISSSAEAEICTGRDRHLSQLGEQTVLWASRLIIIINCRLGLFQRPGDRRSGTYYLLIMKLLSVVPYIY